MASVKKCGCRACGVSSLLAGLMIVAGAHATDEPRGNRLVGGVLFHDSGPTADRHETGLDVNIEYQFAAPDWEFWQRIGAPRPHAGASVSTNGETSVFYSGITYESDVFGRLFGAVHGGLALHDGPLRQKDVTRCRQLSDCGFGSRVRFRGGLEVGVRVASGTSVSILWDHVSHGGILASENEGIDHIGLRLGFNL